MKMTESRNCLALGTWVRNIITRQVKIVHLHTISTLRDDKSSAMPHTDENSLNIQSFNYLMYQLHHFYNYQRRIQQLVDKNKSRRRYFNLCHQKKGVYYDIKLRRTDRGQPALAYLAEVSKTKTLYTFKSHVAL